MLGFPTSTKHEPKCVVTHGTMGHVDASQPPTKRKPFASILSQGFIHKTELILPEELFEIIEKDVLGGNPSPEYSRVILPLSSLLEGKFFNEFIKRGNILMLSEGKVGVENAYTLKEGILTLHLDKESYERAGLVGEPDGVKGKRGTKPWWVVKINLRLPSMLHGKKGFDRIVYAFKNVLTTPVTWLFHDLDITTLEPYPLDSLSPLKKTVVPQITRNIKAKIPSLKPPTDIDPNYGRDFEDYAVETHEWLSMAILESPRLSPDDGINSFLSRYAVPGETTEGSLVKITWQGFISPSWTHRNFVKVLLAIPREAWFAYSVTGFAEGWAAGGQNSMILKLPESPSDFVLWDVV